MKSKEERASREQWSPGSTAAEKSSKMKSGHWSSQVLVVLIKAVLVEK